MNDGEEWTEWQVHDGAGCPDYLIGRLVQVVILLAWNDTWGGLAGGERMQELLVCRGVAANPMWHKANFGRWFRYDTGEFAGNEFCAGAITHFRIRKPRALAELRQLVECLPSDEREVEPV